MNAYAADKVAYLEDAMREAERFLEKADKAIQRLKADDYAYITGSPETAAAKRASMDLTRALVRVRK